MINSLILALSLFFQTPSPNAHAWYYNVSDMVQANVEVFLVCVDAQPTLECQRVPVGSNVSIIEDKPVQDIIDGEQVRHYVWKWPAFLIGTHRVAIQACDKDLNLCSDGVTDTFTVVVRKEEVKNLRRVIAK